LRPGLANVQERSEDTLACVVLFPDPNDILRGTELIVAGEAATLLKLPTADIERAVNFAKQDKAPSTRRAYRDDFTAFAAWCAGRGVNALPALPDRGGVLGRGGGSGSQAGNHRPALRRHRSRPQARGPRTADEQRGGQGLRARDPQDAWHRSESSGARRPRDLARYALRYVRQPEKVVGHSSGGQSLHKWCKERGVHPLDLHVAWVEGTACHR
jgi:hypothetical protein